jgi:formylglycine-generating enzyme required for sulfatase activity
MGLYNILKNREQPLHITDDNRADAFSVPTPLYEPDFAYALGEEPDQPAVTMTQYAAKQYTKWLSLGKGRFYRLPSEAEWEYACRAGSTSAFSFGDDADKLEEYAWYFDNSDDEYHCVGKKLANAWGLFDMHGNVWELVLDQYDQDAYSRLTPKAAAGVVAPTKMYRRVMRGGAWDSDPPDLRSASRSCTKEWQNEDPSLPKSPWWFTDEEALCVGFRIVRPLTAPPPAERGQYWDADVEYLREDVESRIAEGRGVLGLSEPDPED